MVEVRDDEIGALLWSCLFVFSLLAGNYLIRPVRDEMGIAGGTANLPALFAGTFAAMLALGPLLSSRLRARTGRPSIEPILRAHQVCLAGFFVAFHVVPPLGQAWAARAFFILASVANLLVVSIAWGSLVCRFSTDARTASSASSRRGARWGRSPARRWRESLRCPRARPR